MPSTDNPGYPSIVRVRESEAGFTTAVIELAHWNGFLVQHVRPARVRRRNRVTDEVEETWRSPIQGDKGYPDIVAAGWGRLIHAELKVGTNKLEPAQAEWAARLRAGPAEYYTWWPCDWPAIEACFLRKGGPRCVP